MDPTPPKPPDPPDPEVFVSPLSPINDEIRPGFPPSDNTFNNLYYLGTQSQESSNLQFQALIHQEPMDYTVENNRKRSNKEIDAGLVSQLLQFRSSPLKIYKTPVYLNLPRFLIVHNHLKVIIPKVSLTRTIKIPRVSFTRKVTPVPLLSMLSKKVN
ncbi:hypothetical protein O0L34_g13562 [Tuta absoluta]|nr:hypothetical protein O0L34_g13562 [Tuta absoluta]